MGETAIEFDFAHSRVYEVGAALLALLALPDGSEMERVNLMATLCHLRWRGLVESDSPEAASEQLVRPNYLTRTDDQIRTDLKFFKANLEDRVVAGRMAIPFLRKAEGTLPAKLPRDIKRVSLNELADGAKRDLAVVKRGRKGAEADAANIRSRVWRPSLPVIHLAVGLAVTMQDSERTGAGEVLYPHFLEHEWLIERVIAYADYCAFLIEEKRALPGKAVPLIKVRLRPE